MAVIKKDTALEKKLEGRLRDQVKKLGGMCLKFWCLSVSGIPDRIVLMPGGRIWFVELKREGKVPSPIQRRMISVLIRLGFSVWVMDRQATLDLFIDEITKNENGI